MIHKYFTPVLIALLCMYGGKISAKEISVLSPDGKLKVNIESVSYTHLTLPTN